MFTGRTYLVPSSEGISQSASLLTRRYFGDAQTYIGFSGGYGLSSTDIQFEQDIRRLKSWSVSADFQYPINNRILVGASAGFDAEEYQYFERDRLSFKVNVSYRF